MNETRTSAQRYVDILTEAGFKAVFGVEKNKDVLIGLLNIVLPEHRRVTDLAYSTTEIPSKNWQVLLQTPTTKKE